MLLDPQTKLALIRTSAKSDRAMAALLGVSHQQVGRWLRVGDENTPKPKRAAKVPDWVLPSLDVAFSLHIQVCRDQARADGIPFISSIPVFQHRKFLTNKFTSKGQPIKGDRVFSENTQFLRSDIRMKFLSLLHKTGKYVTGSVRSTVDFLKYTQRVVDEEREGRHNFESRRSMVTQKLKEFFAAKHEIYLTGSIQSIYTPRENFGRYGVAPEKAVENMLRRKHSSSAIDYADQYLFQLSPSRNDDNSTPKQAPRSTPAGRAYRESLKRK